MSRTPYFYVEKYNIETNSWEKQVLYTMNKNKGNMIEVDFWPWNATYDVFNIVTHKDRDFPEFTGVRHRFPPNASKEITNSYQNCWYSWDDTEGNEHISKPDAFYFTLADLLLYIKEYPIVKDYETMEDVWTANSDMKWEDVPEQTMPNPMSGVATRLLNYMEFIDDFWNAFGHKSELRIVGWIL